MQEIEKELKLLVHFDLNNKTNLKILNAIYLKYSYQNFYKNGKPKGKPYDILDYYFFDNAKDYDDFMLKHRNTPKALSNIVLVVDEGLRYDKNFLLENLNKN